MATHPSWYKPDRELLLRMLLTVVLLGIVYAAFLYFLLQLGVYLPVLFVIAGLYLGTQVFFADKIALHSMHARVVSEDAAPELHQVLARLAAQTNLPKPRLAIVNSSMPNAFATGRSKNHAVVVLTTGLLNRVQGVELEAVLAHELTHVLNRDLLVMTAATFFSTVASLIVSYLYRASFTAAREDMLTSTYRNQRVQRGGSYSQSLVFIISISLVVYGLSSLLTRALSRYREYAADRGAGLITGAPEHLVSALLRIQETLASGETISNYDVEQARGVSALMILPAWLRVAEGGLLSTHPVMSENSIPGSMSHYATARW